MKEERIKKEKKSRLNVFSVFKDFFSGLTSSENLEDNEDIRSILASDNTLTKAQKEEILGKVEYCEKVKDEMFDDNVNQVVHMNSTRSLNAYKNASENNKNNKINKDAINSSRRGEEREEK